MLKIYRKRLTQARETVELDDLEDEIHDLLRIINERKKRSVPPLPRPPPQDSQTSNRAGKPKVGFEVEVDQLTVLLERSNMADTSMTLTTAAKGQEVLASEA